MAIFYILQLPFPFQPSKTGIFFVLSFLLATYAPLGSMLNHFGSFWALVILWAVSVQLEIQSSPECGLTFKGVEPWV